MIVKPGLLISVRYPNRKSWKQFAQRDVLLGLDDGESGKVQSQGPAAPKQQKDGGYLLCEGACITAAELKGYAVKKDFGNSDCESET